MWNSRDNPVMEPRPRWHWSAEAYRRLANSDDLVSFSITVKQTDMLVSAERNLRRQALVLACDARGQIEREIHYNHLHPFRWAWVLYLVSFFTLLLGARNRLGAGFFTAGLGLHAYGIVLRCLIAGRPPVTNMYESVIWVAFGVAAFALIFSVIYRARVYLLAAAHIKLSLFYLLFHKAILLFVLVLQVF